MARRLGRMCARARLIRALLPVAAVGALAFIATRPAVAAPDAPDLCAYLNHMSKAYAYCMSERAQDAATQGEAPPLPAVKPKPKPRSMPADRGLREGRGPNAVDADAARR